MSAERLPIHRRLGIQLGVAAAVLAALAFVALGGFVVDHERQTLTRQFTLRLISEARSLAVAASGALLRLDPELELTPLIGKALTENPDLADVVVIDSKGRIQGHRDLRQIGAPYERPPAAGGAVSVPGPDQALVRTETGAIVVEQPVRHLGQPIGRLVLRASSAGIERTVRDAQRHLALIGGVATLLTILAVLGLVSFHLRPLGALRRGVLQLGSGDLTTRVQVQSTNELGLFAGLVNSMAEGLQKAQIQIVQKERLDREIEIAHELQSMLLPRSTTVPVGYELEAHYVPALEVSGDYYDVIPLGDGRLLFVTADVSGKGVPGLVVMSMLRTAIHSMAEPRMCLSDVLVKANVMLRGSMQRGMFVTCVCGILDTGSSTIRYVSAGHCPPVRFSPRGAASLAAGGKPLGIFPDLVLRSSLVERELLLAPGEGLLLCTDGLFESLDASGQQLGLDAVMVRLHNTAERPAKIVVAQLLGQVREHQGSSPASDDLTLIVLRREACAVVASAGGRT